RDQGRHDRPLVGLSRSRPSARRRAGMVAAAHHEGIQMTVVRAAAVAALVALTGCSTLASRRGCPSGEQPATMDSLYFGAAFPQGEVTQQAWEHFVAEVVTPRFPKGLTSWPASGQWRGAAGTVQKESSYVLNIVRPEPADDDAALRDVIAIYKQRFHQEAVLHVRSAACISF